MKARIWIIGALITLTIAPAVSARTLPTPPGPQGALAARPILVKETRVHNLRPTDDRSTSMFDKPGLVVTLEVALPKGKRLIDIEQPTEIAATDSVGTDLTLVPAGFNGQKDFWEMVFDTEREQGRVKLAVASPRRDARTFSVTATAAASIYSGTEPVTLARAAAWTPLDAPRFGTGAQYRVTESARAVSVEFKPDEVHDLVESLAFVDGGNQIKSNSSMWGMGTAHYSFESAVPKAARLVATVRVGFEQVPVRVEIQYHPLP